MNWLNGIGKAINNTFSNVGKSISYGINSIGKALNILGSGTIQREINLSDEEKLMAEMADVAYKGYENYKNYTLDNELSFDGNYVYKNKDHNNDIIMALRGTDNKKDLISDIGILTNNQKYDKRFIDTLEQYNKVKSKYNNSNIRITGHSLAGSLTKHILKNNKDDNIKGFGFNSGQGLSFNEMFEDWMIKDNRFTNYKIGGDPVSALSTYGKVKYFDIGNKGILGNHSIHKFLS